MKILIVILALIKFISSSAIDNKFVSFEKIGTYNGKSFYIHKHLKSIWIEANLVCQSYGMELATIENLHTIMKIIRKLRDVDESRYDKVLLDGMTSNDGKISNWYWFKTQEKIPEYFPWYARQPLTYYKCLSLSRDNGYYMTTVECSSGIYPALCQVIESNEEDEIENSIII